MKNLLVLAALLASATASAGEPFIPSASDFRDESQWAFAMVAQACSADLSDAVAGTVTKGEKGVIFSALNDDGEVIAAATAKSTFVLSRKSCL